MKKFAAILLSLCLLLSVAVAETTKAPKEIKWDDYKALADTYEGAFYKLSDTGLQMYVPNTMKDVELTQEQLDKGIFLICATEDKSLVLTCQIVMAPIDTVKASLTDAGAKEVDDGILNGINSTSFQAVDANGAQGAGVLFSASQGERVIMISLAPITEENKPLVSLMFASIQEVAE